MKSRNLGYFGIILTVISAFFYLLYPTNNDWTLITYLTIVWGSALFGGMIVGMSVERQKREKEEKKNQIERGREWD